MSANSSTKSSSIPVHKSSHESGNSLKSSNSTQSESTQSESTRSGSTRSGSTQSGSETEIFLDWQRESRCGFPEAVFGEGKSPEQLLSIARQQISRTVPVFITRISSSAAEFLLENVTADLERCYNETAKTLLIRPNEIQNESSGTSQSRRGYVPVVAAGTTDLPVVEEALETLNWMRVDSCRIMDVGVAGPHRLPEKLKYLLGADAVIVVAGMEGALPSIVGGYVDCPVIAVPTSVGYGANLGGVSALLSMLNSCAANVSVVNIDAGFKGAYVAGMIARRAHRDDHSEESIRNRNQKESCRDT